jgi:hypothetical protein
MNEFPIPSTSVSQLLSTQIPTLFACEQRGDIVHIQTPFCLPDGDMIEVFAPVKEGQIATLTDLGETCGWLWVQAVQAQFAEHELAHIAEVCANYRLDFAQKTISVRVANADDFAAALLRMIQGILAVAILDRALLGIGVQQEQEEASR